MQRISLCLLLVLTGLLMACNSSSTTQNTETAKDTRPATLPTLQPGEAVATLAGGCFWCLQEELQSLKGVRAVVSGYAGGTLENPTYEQVGTDQTGHAESVQVYYDPNVLPFGVLLDGFFAGHDPTTPNQEGPDVGSQYRSIAFYRTPAEKAAIEAAIKRANASGYFRDPVVTQVVPFKAFYPAEVYHQGYYALHPDEAYIQRVSLPKVTEFRKRMAAYLKSATAAQ